MTLVCDDHVLASCRPRLSWPFHEDENEKEDADADEDEDEDDDEIAS